MPIVPLENIGVGGLNTDEPKEALGMEFWDTGLDMRSYEGALRGVPDFDTSVATVRLYQNMTDGPDHPTNEESIRPLEITQWTPAGEDFVDILTVGLDNTDGGKIYRTGGGTDPAVVFDCSLPYTFTYDQQYGPQAFIFNEVAVVNPTTAAPMYSFDRESFYVLPNWFGEEIGSALTAISQYSIYKIETVVDDDWSSIGGRTNSKVGDVFTASTASADISALGTVKAMHPYLTKRVTTYNGRLVALNLFNDYNDGDVTNDINSPIELAYSSSVEELGSILELEWYASFRNTAGNAFLTQTPGRVVDAVQLGEFLMVYKTDAVIRMQDTGEPLFVVGDTAFLDDGVLSEGCVADIGSNRHLVVGQYGIYIHSGGPEKEVISHRKVEKFFYEDLPTSVADRNLTFVHHNTLDKEVWICYRNKAAASGDTYKGCTRALVYNYEQGTWYLRSLPNVTSIEETEIEGAVRTFAASIDVVPNSSIAGSLYEFDTDNLVSDGYIQWTSRGLGGPDKVKAIDGIYPTSQEEFDIRIVAADNSSPPDVAAETPKQFNPASQYKRDFRKLGRYYSMRWAMNGSVDPVISTCAVDMRELGVR